MNEGRKLLTLKANFYFLSFYGPDGLVLNLRWNDDGKLVIEGDRERIDEAALVLFESLKAHVDGYVEAKLAER